MAAAHKGKAIVLRWLGARQMLYLLRWIRMDLPSVALELVSHYPVEVLVVHGIVRAEGCGIIVVDDRLVWVWCVVGAEDDNERRDFALEFDVEGFEDV